DYTHLIALSELPQGADTSSPSGVVLTKSNVDLKKALGDLDALKADASAKRYADLDARYFKTLQGPDNKPHPRFEVYVQVYDLADGLMVTSDSLKAEGSLTPLFDAATAQYSKASDDADKVRTQEELLTAVIAKTQFAIDASLRAKKYLYSVDALALMPDKAEAWPDYVGRLAAAGPKDNILRPQVPLVNFPDPKNTFNPKYAPDTVGAALDALDAVARVAGGGGGAAGGASAPRVLDAAVLASRASTIRKAFDAYRTDYIRYWREETRDDLHLTYKNFATFAGDLVATSEKSIRASLDDYGKRIIYALGKVNASEDVAAVSLDARLNSNTVFQGDCASVFGKWRDLGEDPKLVRRSILNMIPGDFLDNYTVKSVNTSDGFVARYWQSFSRDPLRVLAADSRAEIDAGLKELANYQRFPLALPGDKKDDLPLADVLKARSALERVRGASAGASATTTTGGRLIGSGANTRDREIDASLDLLRGTDLLRDRQDYFDKLDRLFAGLPKDTKPLQVTLSVDKSKLTDRATAISTPFSYMTITADGKTIGQPSSLIAEKADTYTIDLPNAGDLKFDFRAVQSGNPIQSETFSGPWSLLRLILSNNVKSATRDGNKWNIEYTVTTADKKNWSLYLVLEFKQPIPDTKDWPNPK
ncbi:MAG TPA: hypothetical protein VHM90_22325, partial [Phycisphaerae bacterium]|nr:hypothetical protein [Phycisphaerae bacterium]